MKEPRDQQKSLRLTKSQCRAIERAAAAKSLSPSAWMVMTLMAATDGPRRVKP